MLNFSGAMKTVLKRINEMQAGGIMGQSAIGGAVGATFYLEPAAILHVDILAMLPGGAAGSLISLSPIYEDLKAQGCKLEAEHVMIGDWPVQFLPPGSALEEEALRQAVPIELDGVPTRVMTAEHLVAIALKTGRPKDFSRIIQFLQSKAVNMKGLNVILKRHGLVSRWAAFKGKYLRE